MAMTKEELYLFDLQGYITVPNALNAEQLKNLKLIAFVQNDSTGDVLTTAVVELDAK